MCPGKSDGRKKLRDQEGPKDATNGRARYGQPKSEGSSFIKPFSDCAGGRIVPLSAVSNTSFDPRRDGNLQHGVSNAKKESLRQKNLIVLGGEAGADVGHETDDSTWNHDASCSPSVECWANKETTDKHQEELFQYQHRWLSSGPVHGSYLNTTNPSHCRNIFIFENSYSVIPLENTKGVHDTCMCKRTLPFLETGSWRRTKREKSRQYIPKAVMKFKNPPKTTNQARSPPSGILTSPTMGSSSSLGRSGVLEVEVGGLSISIQFGGWLWCA